MVAHPSNPPKSRVQLVLSGIWRRGANKKVAEKEKELSRLDGGSTCAVYLLKDLLYFWLIFSATLK